MWMQGLILALSLALLAAGADALVRGASRLAVRLGISSLVIGLTVVAYGTSAPEMLVSVLAAIRGNPDIAVANVVGSNLFNTLLILGLCATISPLVVTPQLLRRDVPIMIAATVLLICISLDGRISRLEGLLLACGAGAYSLLCIRAGRRREGPGKDAESGRLRRGAGWLLGSGLVAAGLALMVLGARWLVGSAVEIARAVGVSDLIIGLTVVAAGTSLPEVATSVVATIRGQRDIAIGNVIGSNISNILAILGLSAAVVPGGLRIGPQLLQFDLPVLLGVSLICLPFMITGRLFARWEGALFLGYYLLYSAYVVRYATGHARLGLIADLTASVVLPLTMLTLLIEVVRAVAARRKAGRPV
ncbi:MAG: calcium/sodium antiporter [Acidobacteriota bacterium]